MAKGNLFLGLARGSVGDVTMYRRDGNQVSRARVRKIANPKSSGQIYTRAILATVAKAYSAGKAVFDHAFEGYKVPEGAQRRFLKLNLDALRSRVYDDVEQQTDVPYSTPLVGPNSPSPVAGEFIVSEGSLSQNFIKITPATADDGAVVVFGGDFTEGETVAQMVSRYGLAAGDIFTFIFFAFGAPMAGLTPRTEFGWVQFRLREDAIESTEVATLTPIAQIFDVTKSPNVTQDITGFDINEDMSIYRLIKFPSLLSPYVTAINGTFAVIRSRDDSPLRSSAQMQWLVGDDHGGLAWSQVVDAWTGGYQLGESDLLLEGSEFPRQAPAVTVTASFAMPTSITQLATEENPTLILSRSVNGEQLLAGLKVTSSDDALSVRDVDGTLYLSNGTTQYAQLTLSADGRSVAITNVLSAQGSPTLIAFSWQ